jgi:cysteinyl-tRNA synthetase
VISSDYDIAEPDASSSLDADVEVLILERTKARADKNFARADEIRDELTALGVEIMDTPDGVKWKKRTDLN